MAWRSSAPSTRRAGSPASSTRSSTCSPRCRRWSSGIWGIFVLVPSCRTTCTCPSRSRGPRARAGLLPVLGPPAGYNLITASHHRALLLMCRTRRRRARRDPAGAALQREVARALGATRWEVTAMAVLPCAAAARSWPAPSSASVAPLARRWPSRCSSATPHAALHVRTRRPRCHPSSSTSSARRSKTCTSRAWMTVGFYLFLISLTVSLLLQQPGCSASWRLGRGARRPSWQHPRPLAPGAGWPPSPPRTCAAATAATAS